MALKIHFLNVGHGDCTMIEFPSNRKMMIDINNSKSLPDDDIDALANELNLSRFQFKTNYATATRTWEQYYQSKLVDPVDYFKDKFPDSTVFRYIQTHPDMDHLSGIANFFWTNAIPLENFWDTDHNKELKEDDFKNSRFDYVDWLTYKILRDGIGPDKNIKNPSVGTFRNLRGNTGQYWDDDGISILSPTQEIIDECNKADSYNNCSYVLKITHAGRSVILPGDAESLAWKSILDHYTDDFLSCDILKASHHGRKSGFHEDAVSAMSPRAVICSVGKKPSTDASSEYARLGAKVFSTRYHGSITVTIWNDGDIWIEDPEGSRLLTLT